MGDNRNFAALDWVIGEIDETLKDARQALEAYVEDTRDSTRIRFCLTHIHQVYGTLQMVEFHGASLLAEEMEQLAQAIMNNAVASASEAQEVLMRSLLQLPIYLEHVKSQREDQPGVVLPLLNDLRAVRKQSYLSETNLFSPDLSAIRKAYGKRHPVTGDKTKFAQVLKKLREMYQFAAAGVLRGIKIDENLTYLDKVCSRLELLTRGTACYPTWEVSAALIDAVRRDDVELSVAVRGLLRYLARELRLLGEKAPDSLSTLPRESLLKNLLYYVARAGKSSDRVVAVKARYQLQNAILNGQTIGDGSDSSSLSSPDPEAIRSVIVALNEEIEAIRNVLDTSIAGGIEPSTIKEVMPVVKRVGDTLAVLGIGDLRKQVVEQYSHLEKIAGANEVSEQDLLKVANNVVEIEQKLDAISKVVGTSQDLGSVDQREVEIDQAKVTVIKECQHGLEQIKDAIVAYYSSKWDKVQLQNVGSLLTNIRGGLEMIPLRRAAAVLDSCNHYIQEELLGRSENPSWKSLETLADAIACVEYYLERLLEDLDDEGILLIAENSVATLSYPVSVIPDHSITSESRSKPQTEKQEEHSASERKSVVPEPQTDFNEASGADFGQWHAEDSASEQSAETTDTSLGAEIRTADVDSKTISAENEPPKEKAPAFEPAPAVSEQKAEPEPESDIDDEIIEIFIEEAGEVTETLEEYFPQWSSNTQNQDALVVVRRAFHTLKGSGRMVEAYDIGELAWSVENMLNRVIDNTVQAGKEHIHLIARVLKLLPELVDAFAKQKPNPKKSLTEQYMAWGVELSEGKLPQALANPIPEGGDDTALAQQAPAGGDKHEETDENLILLEIFSSEAATHLRTVGDFVAQSERDAPLYSPPSDDLQRALHTLKGSAKMALVLPVAQMSEPLESFAKELISYQVSVNTDILQLLKDLISYTQETLSQIKQHQAVTVAKVDLFVARVMELREIHIGPLLLLKEAGKEVTKQVDPRLLSIFMAEEMSLLLDAETLLRRWQNHELVEKDVAALINELALLENGAFEANLPVLAALANQLQTLYSQALNGKQPLVEDFFDVVLDGHNTLLDMVDRVAAGQSVFPPSETISAALDDLIVAGQSAVPEFVQEALPESIAVQEAEAEEFSKLTSAADADETASGSELDVVDDQATAELATEVTPEAPSVTSDSTDELQKELGSAGDTLAVSESEIAEEEIDTPSVGESESLVDDEAITLSDVVADSRDTLETAEGDDHEGVDDSESQDETPLILDFSETELLAELASPEQVDLTGEYETENDGTDIPTLDAFADESVEETTEEQTLSEEKPEEETLLTIEDTSAITSGDESPVEDLVFSASEKIELEGLSSDTSQEQEGDSEITLTDIHLDAEENVVEGSESSAGESVLEGFDTEISLDDLPVLELEAEPTHENAEQEPEAEENEALELIEAPLLEDLVTDDAPISEENIDTLEDEPIVDGSTEETFVAQEQPSTTEETSEPQEQEQEQKANIVGIPGLLDDIDLTDEDVDIDIIEVFLEEADEIIEALDESVHTWESDWSNQESVDEIKRALHTLKGGARLAGMMNLGELTHEYESYLLGLKLEDVDESFFRRIHQYQDKVLTGVRAVQTFIQGDEEQVTATESFEASSDTPEFLPTDEVEQQEPKIDVSTLKTEKSLVDAGNVLPFAKPKPKQDEAAASFTMPAVPQGSGAQAPSAAALRKSSSGPQEVIKVSAELLEELVNLAGETSISRGRLEEQISEFGTSLDEVDGTLNRLQEQLRRLDIETEAQILFRQEQIGQHMEDFDPLEMDRYSSLQQLSRSLMESASDLVDLKSTLSDKLRDTETILLQQSRINTTLQEGLMRSRMVPFSRLVPRLRRIVRQVASELGKSVSFELDNIEGELDRSVLERMVPPLEHMLRNAVDHGIEMPEDRLDAGKPESGRIVLTLGREGGDVLLRLADDGQGVNLRRVREIAVERGLMIADAELSDLDVMQFILHAGFSTAENVTQISGRGVGMDVVSSEIKQLGGSVTINSEWGKGTEFVVRLPFTVSVNRALMVAIGSDTYAVPLNTIEGIVRVSPYELEHYYSTPDARFEYAGENYQVRYLGAMLSPDLRPKFEGQILPLPVLLVRSAEHTMALQVDAVMGSREIVVKSLGVQFNAVQGMSGATVMGDGRVVVILDPHALVRKEMALSYAAMAMLESANEDTESDAVSRVKTVMVVDDSVTVRKVTTRFLEREGYLVITAKDGVDALRMLQDEIPDLMLLDIEMPRMDGFEVAKNVRGTRRWKHIPIIMITSRTGEKHREHALSLGVDGYLGKPYQEDILLESITQLFDKNK